MLGYERVLRLLNVHVKFVIFMKVVYYKLCNFPEICVQEF